jgi:hypothetical protein
MKGRIREFRGKKDAIATFRHDAAVTALKQALEHEPTYTPKCEEPVIVWLLSELRPVFAHGKN